MKQIPLNRGLFALVDDADFESLSQFKWTATRAPKCKTFYAVRQIYVDGKRKQMRMHRQLLPGARYIDHKDRNGLNNQRENLRPCTQHQNLGNSVWKNKHGFKGVRLDRRNKSNPWLAKIFNGTRTLHLGNFSKKEEAALAYDKKAMEFFGEFARLNFPL